MKYRTTALFLLSACSAYSCSSSDGQRANADSANPSDDHGNTAATATLVLAGTAAAGNIEVSDDADWFKFQATASHIYRFQLQRKTLPSRDGHVFIIDTDQKTEIKNTRNQVTLTFPTAGTYFVRVQNPGGFAPGTGTYELRIDDIGTDDHADLTENATELGIDMATNGTIEHQTDKDWFRFTAEAGEIYSLVVDTELGLGQGFVELYEGDETKRLAYRSEPPQIYHRFDKTGTYFVKVRGKFDTGAYSITRSKMPDDEFGDDASTVSVLATGVSQEGGLQHDKDFDWFRFVPEAGHVYEFELVGKTLDAGWIGLYNQDGEKTLAAGRSPDSTIAWEFETTGTYFVVVSGSLAGTYELTAHDLGPDDHGPSIEKATALVMDADWTSGRVVVPNEKDFFSFTPLPGRNFHVIVNERSEIYAGVTLYNQDGTQLQYANVPTEMQRFASEAASYYVEVSGLRDNVGDYRIQVVQGNGDVHGGDAASATPISVPAQLQGRIDFDGDADWFRFEGQIGHIYQADTNVASSLVGPDGTTEVVRPQHGPWYYEAKATGPHYWVIGRMSAQDYHLDLKDLGVDDHGNSAANASIAPLGTSIEGLIQGAEDFDWFKFDAAAEEILQFNVGGGRNTRLFLYDRDGTTKIHDTGAATSRYNVTTSGTYYVALHALPRTRYTLHIESLGQDDHGDELDTASEAMLNTVTNGSLEHHFDNDWFRFDGVSGHDYHIDLTIRVHSNHGLFVYDSDGNQTSVGGPDFLSGVFTPESDGTYYVRVFATARREISGPYSLRIVDLATDDHGNSAADASTLELGTTQSGLFHTRSDEDWFKIVAAADGEIYNFRLEAPKAFSPRMTLYHTDGTTPLEYWHGGGRSYRFDAGTYYIAVKSRPGLTPYRLSVTRPLPDDYGNRPEEAFDISISDTIKGNIESVLDYDSFSFSPLDKHLYSIQVWHDPLDTLREPLAVLIDKTHRHFDIHKGFIKFRAISAEPVVVRVRDRDLDGVGGYFVRVVDIGIDDHGESFKEATNLAAGSSISGEISMASERDYFAITMGENEVHHFGISAVGAPVSLSLYDTEGDSILAIGGSSTDGISWRVEEGQAGTYYLRVDLRRDFTKKEGSAAYTLTSSGPLNDDHGNDAATATTGQLDTLIDGNTETPQDSDWFAIELRADVLYHMSIRRPWGGMTPVTLYRPDGTTPIDELGTESVTPFTPLRDGVYYFDVRSDVAGAYQLLVHEAKPDDHGDGLTNATPIVLNTPVAGYHENKVDRDSFQFEAEAGEIYHILGLTTTGKKGGFMLVMNEHQVRVASPNLGDRHPDGTVFLPEISGTYYLVRYASQGDHVGAYEVMVSNFSGMHHGGDEASTAELITEGSSVSSFLTASGDKDWYAVEATSPGTWLTVTAKAPNYSNVHIELLDVDGRRVLGHGARGHQASDHLVIQQILVSSGTYFIVVHSKDPFAAYELSVEKTIAPGYTDDSGTVYEDAEDGDSQGWTIYDPRSGGASYANVFDDERQSRVIELVPGGDNPIADGFMLQTADGTFWNNREEFVAEWSMNFESPRFYVYVDVETTGGQRYITYTEATTNRPDTTQKYVYIGLGPVNNGAWNTVTRDLQKDLESDPQNAGEKIVAVRRFLVRGRGRLDDIQLQSSVPSPNLAE